MGDGGPQGRGVDVSEWQGILSVDWFAQWRFAIVRVHSGFSEDRYHRENLRNVAASGTPWGVYGFMVHQRDLNGQADAVLDLTRDVGLGEPPIGYWCDAEVLGDETDGIRIYCDRWRSRGVADALNGYYSNDWRVDHDRLADLAYWTAGYPSPNDGHLEPRGHTRRDPVLWQFTSTNGTLDQNVVVDEAWFAAHTGGAPAPGPPPSKKGRSVIYDEHKDDGTHAYWTEGLGGYVPMPETIAKGQALQGDLVIAINTLDFIALGIARDAQASKWLDSKVEPVPPAPGDPGAPPPVFDITSPSDDVLVAELIRRLALP